MYRRFVSIDLLLWCVTGVLLVLDLATPVNEGWGRIAVVTAGLATTRLLLKGIAAALRELREVIDRGFRELREMIEATFGKAYDLGRRAERREIAARPLASVHAIARK